MVEVYFELGGNQGDRLQLINLAKQKLKQFVGEIESESSVYETPPWGFESDDNFYNQIVTIKTDLEITELLKITQSIEKDLGRVRGTERYVSRTMDIDVLFYGNEIIELPNIEVPHPRIQDRKFVLMPLTEISQDLIHPKLQQSVTELLQQCTDESDCIIVS